jgi:hypothetical protein
MAEDGTGGSGLPELDFDDTKARRHADIVEGLGEVLRGRISRENEDRLTVRSKDVNERIVLVKGHPVVEIFIDPSAEGTLDVAEISEHAAIVEVFSFDRDDGSAVVSMKESAFAIVIDEAVPVAESEFLGDAKHRLPPFESGVLE